MRIRLPLAMFLLAGTAACAQAPYPDPGQGGPGQGYGQNQPQGPGPGPAPYGQQGGDPSMGQPPPGQFGQQGGAPGYGQPPQAQQGGQPLHGAQRFEAANVTHDGKLTRDQAQAGGLHGIVANFDAIDREHKGYVTKQDIREWRKARRASRQQVPPAQ